MSLYKYFTSNVKLPDPTNAPSTLPQSSIAAANKEVKKLMSQPGASEKSRGSYDKYTIEQRTAIGKKTYECGITKAIKYYSCEKNGSLELKESSVKTWKNAYEKELAKRKRERPDDDGKDILLLQ